MDQRRRTIETNILERFFHKRYMFEDVGAATESVKVGIKTQSGTVYQLKIELRNFPAAKPDVYIIYPAGLKNRSGGTLSTVSHTQHTLSPKDGFPQICHYKPAAWTPNITLYKVILKCRVWLEAYEAHLSSNKSIDDYLKS